MTKITVDLRECKFCHRLMVDDDFRRKYSLVEPWAAGGGESCDMCQDCARTGNFVFECALCKETRDGKMVARAFGSADNAEYLCRVCYETRTAKDWAEAVDELSDKYGRNYE